MDPEKIKAFEDLVSGKVDPKNANAYMIGLMQGKNGEPPFLKTRRGDIDSLINQKSLELAPKFEEIKKITREQLVGDKLQTTVKEERVINEVASRNFGQLVYQSIIQDKGVQGIIPTYTLDSSEKLKEFGVASTTPTNDMQEYVMNMFDYSDVLEPKTTVVSEATEVAPKSATGPSAGFTPIERTEIGWDFGSTPVSLTKEVSYDEDGVERKTSLKNASVVAVNQEDGDYFALINIPRSADKEAKEFSIRKEKERREERDEQKAAIDANEDLSKWQKRKQKKLLDKEPLLTQEDQDMVVQIKSDPDRTKVIKVPLDKALHGELRAKFKKSKLDLRGFNEITFEDKVKETPESETQTSEVKTYSVGGNEIPEPDLISAYKEKYPDKSEEEIIQAIKKQFGE
jgi:hypothetical protein